MKNLNTALPNLISVWKIVLKPDFITKLTPEA